MVSKNYISQELRDRVNARISECLALAEKRFGQSFGLPNVVYDCVGTKGGYAKLGDYSLHFNPIILNENVEHYIMQTVPHEVAHLIDHKVYGFQFQGRSRVSVHGRTWKHIMRLFGLNADRCHNYNVDNAQQRVKNKFHYKCPDCGHDFFLGPVRHRKAQAGAKFFGRCCPKRGAIVFQANLGQVTFNQAKEKVA